MLKKLAGIAVNTVTQEEYDELINILAKNNYSWIFSTDLTSYNAWTRYEKKTCVKVNSAYINYFKKPFLISNGYKIISLDRFKELQGLKKKVK